ncbi:MAG TPA: hypothetical protein VLC50_03915, partial [Actinomycetes bacterium]|nr:hypothetical protein [Actinomycetes bacterium]
LNDLLAVVALAAAWALLSWLAMGVAVCALASSPRALGGVLVRAAEVLTPALLRRLVGALVGGAVLVGPVFGAQAATASQDLGAARAAVPMSVAAGPGHAGPGAGAPAPVVFDRPEAVRPVSVVVRPGDALWTIAARALAASGVDPSPAEIAAEWPRWHAANRQVIGDDPDLLRPGQVLAPPAPPARPTPSR